MMKWLADAAYWLRNRAGAVRRWAVDRFTPPYRTLVVENNLPPKLRKRTLYIVQEDGFEEQAAMLCPCGSNHILHMNLLPDERPLWRVTRHRDGSATLNPSVWRKKDCKSHFWFRNGRVIWVRQQPVNPI
jgi:hypothetical protein